MNLTVDMLRGIFSMKSVRVKIRLTSLKLRSTENFCMKMMETGKSRKASIVWA